MGLFDWFRRAPKQEPPTPRELIELWAVIGAHGADLETLKGRAESLRDEWAVMRDEIRKLVNRLEKRDQRAAEKEEPSEPQGSPEVEGMRAIRARRGNGLLPNSRPR